MTSVLCPVSGSGQKQQHIQDSMPANENINGRRFCDGLKSLIYVKNNLCHQVQCQKEKSSCNEKSPANQQSTCDCDGREYIQNH